MSALENWQERPTLKVLLCRCIGKHPPPGVTFPEAKDSWWFVPITCLRKGSFPTWDSAMAYHRCVDDEHMTPKALREIDVPHRLFIVYAAEGETFCADAVDALSVIAGRDRWTVEYAQKTGG
jgi:hypothetical protein